MAVTIKGTVKHLSPWGAPPEEIEIKKLGKVISSILGITKCAVDECFY